MTLTNALETDDNPRRRTVRYRGVSEVRDRLGDRETRNLIRAAKHAASLSFLHRMCTNTGGGIHSVLHDRITRKSDRPSRIAL